ncbi:hypothetical protein SPRG_00121 [Saprolegnia parasitica CBS 223.65]|uniref:Nuclear nucleic acid-binding protein C1D n=1 Tax=Saprolegnia parasitica (strain CBS 223.65) TaxID=695850 RepID=A0A067CX59_SAPPC|nr:hypothetical protein SPRG_00121 [Saprolegnia parasitica CBS 223.65]KDO35274.1 hypothetical protein SPRG_00121 [Saprolegnia parasitica CBS 223.65]|eukprot:XP_012193624.1 hypothetical protein SPRG_00121 [Saprolegnia parasitica CBS 223.65]
MAEHLANVSSALGAIEEYLAPLTKASVDELTKNAAPIEKAKLQVGLAYSVNALLYILLKTQGASSKDLRQTQVKQELDRVKGFVQKIKYSEEMAKGPQVKVDAEAAGRFINHALSSDQVYVKALNERKAEEKTEETKTEEKEPQPKASKKTKKAPTTSTSTKPAKKQRKH